MVSHKRNLANNVNSDQMLQNVAALYALSNGISVIIIKSNQTNQLKSSLGINELLQSMLFIPTFDTKTKLVIMVI